MSRRAGSPAPHIHTQPTAMPRAPGLHDITPQPASHTPAPTLPAGRISNAQKRPPYDGAELRAHTRPGAQDFLAHPSRMGDQLHYRDGRVLRMTTTPSEA